MRDGVTGNQGFFCTRSLVSFLQRGWLVVQDGMRAPPMSPLELGVGSLSMPRGVPPRLERWEGDWPPLFFCIR